MTHEVSAPTPNWHALFRSKLATNVRGWSAFLAEHEGNPAALSPEFANIQAAIQRALAESSAQDDAFDLVLRLYTQVNQGGRWLTWRDTLEQALAAARTRGDRRTEMRVLDQLGEMTRSLGESESGIRWQESALALARELNDLFETGRILQHLGQHHLALNSFAAADACAVEAEAIFRLPDHEGAPEGRRWLAHTLVLRSQISQRTGELEQALEYVSQADRLYDELGDALNRAYTTNTRGQIYQSQRRWDDAGECYANAEELFRAQGNEMLEARLRMNYAITLHYRGETERALLLLREAKTVFERTGDRVGLALALNNEGNFLQTLGRYDEAVVAFEHSGELHRANGNLANLAGALFNRAEALLDTNRPADAAALVRDANEVLASMERPPTWFERTRKNVLQRLADLGLLAGPREEGTQPASMAP